MFFARSNRACRLKSESSIQIRSALDTEQELLRQIFNTARVHAGCFHQPELDPQDFAAAIEGEALSVAELSGLVAGFVSVWVPDRFIHHLYVLPAFHSKGVGGALLDWCEQQYGPGLSLKCTASNLKAQRFYRSHGWVPRESGISDDGPWDRLCLIRS